MGPIERINSRVMSSYFLAALILTSLAADTDAEPPKIEPLKVCARPNAGFLSPSTNGASGLEFDLLSSFASAQGRELELIWLESFQDLIPSVQKGRCDIGAAGVMVTDARSLQVAFSTPYFPVRVILVEPKTRLTQSPKEMVGLRVAVVEGTVHEDIVGRMEGVEVKAVEDDISLFHSITDGSADAAVCDTAIVLPFLADFPDMRVRFPLSERAFFAFPLPQGSPWVPKLNQHLAELKESDRYREMLIEHFGVDGASFILDDGKDAEP